MKKNFSSHVMTVFANHNTDHETMTTIMTDLALGREIYDSEGNAVSKAEAADLKKKLEEAGAKVDVK